MPLALPSQMVSYAPMSSLLQDPQLQGLPATQIPKQRILGKRLMNKMASVSTAVTGWSETAAMGYTQAAILCQRKEGLASSVCSPARFPGSFSRSPPLSDKHCLSVANPIPGPDAHFVQSLILSLTSHASFCREGPAGSDITMLKCRLAVGAGIQHARISTGTPRPNTHTA